MMRPVSQRELLRSKAANPTRPSPISIVRLIRVAKLRELADAMVRLANLMDRQGRPKEPLN